MKAARLISPYQGSQTLRFSWISPTTRTTKRLQFAVCINYLHRFTCREKRRYSGQVLVPWEPQNRPLQKFWIWWPMGRGPDDDSISPPDVLHVDWCYILWWKTSNSGPWTVHFEILPTLGRPGYTKSLSKLQSMGDLLVILRLPSSLLYLPSRCDKLWEGSWPRGGQTFKISLQRYLGLLCYHLDGGCAASYWYFPHLYHPWRFRAVVVCCNYFGLYRIHDCLFLCSSPWSTA